jgi:thiol-disulfide isomerase/thioredoxin
MPCVRTGRNSTVDDMFSMDIFKALPLGLTICIGAGSLQAQAFHGQVSKQLSIDTSIGTVLLWDKADPSVAQDLNIDPSKISELYRGDLKFGKAQALDFGAALCFLKDGEKIFLVDLHSGGGQLHNPTRIPLTSPSQPYHSAEARFNIPLQTGPFRTAPAYVALPKNTEGYPMKPNQAMVIVGDRPYVTGEVKLPTRTIKVRYSFDPDTGTTNLKNATEWFDINGDGIFDPTPGNVEVGTPSAAMPTFHVNDLWLQTESLDLSNHKLALKVVPADVQRIPLVVGGKIPNFSFKDFSGETRQFSGVKAKYILLDFWATWCVPCVADLPSRKEAYDRFHAKGFEILGMNGDAETEKPRKLLQKLNASWPEAKPDHDLLQNRFHITSWPTLVLVDGNGTIVSTSQADHLPLSGQGLAVTLGHLLP